MPKWLRQKKKVGHTDLIYLLIELLSKNTEVASSVEAGTHYVILPFNQGLCGKLTHAIETRCGEALSRFLADQHPNHFLEF